MILNKADNSVSIDSEPTRMAPPGGDVAPPVEPPSVGMEALTLHQPVENLDREIEAANAEMEVHGEIVAPLSQPPLGGGNHQNDQLHSIAPPIQPVQPPDYTYNDLHSDTALHSFEF